ncbi:MAG TPA: ABC transporter ATP-binding protein [Casimicrobiaceae bacterium]|nr:ABC transporter ATP-binding protein [Casimicrobiaceae bacterium]
MTGAPILATRGLTVEIAGVRVCCDLDFAVEPGQCWAILGRNGAGKTTLLSTLAGLRPVSAGTIEIDGRPLSGFAPRELARVRALLPQDDSDAFPATALETALVGRHPHLGRWQWEGAEDLRIARAALAAVDMDGAEARDVRTLSGGERRRVTLAATLAQEPRLFLLDEPSSHLDLAHQVALLDRLVALARSGERALVMALHDVNLASRCCDHVLLLDRGAAAAGPCASLLTSERLSALYGVALRSFSDGGRSVFVT